MLPERSWYRAVESSGRQKNRSMPGTEKSSRPTQRLGRHIWPGLNSVAGKQPCYRGAPATSKWRSGLTDARLPLDE